jgi:hypothetical protein
MNSNFDTGGRYLFWFMPGVFLVLVVIVLYIRGQINEKRIARDPHVQAKILEAWVVTDRKTGRPMGVSGRIKYARTAKNKTFDCDVTSHLGSLEANYEVGEILEIVPWLDSCYEPIILGRLHR